MKRKILAELVICSMVGGLLCSCGDKKKQEMLTEYNIASENISDKQTSGDAMCNIPKEYVIKENSMDGDLYTLNCKTDLDGMESAAIYEVEIQNIDDKYILDLAKTLFDGGNYEVLAPYGTLSEDSIEEVHKELNNNGVYDMTTESVIIPALYYKYFETVDYEEGNVIVETKSFGGAREARIRGEMDGKEYELSFLDMDLLESPVISIYQTKPVHKYIDATKNAKGILETENKKVDKENADKMVKDFVDKLGFLDYEVASISSRWCEIDSEEDSRGELGYIYSLRRYVGGVLPEDYMNYQSAFLYTKDEAEGPWDGIGCQPEHEDISVDEDDIDMDAFLSYLPIDDAEFDQEHDAVILEGDTLERSQMMGQFVGETEDKISIDIDDTGILAVQLRSFGVPKKVNDTNLNKLSFEQSMDVARDTLGNCYIRNLNLVNGNSNNIYDVNMKFTYVKQLYQNKKIYMPTIVFEKPVDEELKYGDIAPKTVYFGIGVIDGEKIGFIDPMQPIIVVEE